jgi:hypothetical protein
MRLLGKTALVTGVAAAMALGSMTASEARNGRNAALAGGFIAGAAIGAAAANANSGYYGRGYGYDSYAYAPGYGYDSYAAAPGYGYYDAPARAYTGDPAYNPNYGYSGYNNYNSNYNGPMRERQLEGNDY